MKCHVKINFNFLNYLAKKLFGNSKSLYEFEETKKILDTILDSSELKKIYCKYAKKTENGFNDNFEPLMTHHELNIFFEKEQKINLSIKEIFDIIDFYNVNENEDFYEKNAESDISYFTFYNIIFSDHNLIFINKKTFIYQV